MTKELLITIITIISMILDVFFKLIGFINQNDIITFFSVLLSVFLLCIITFWYIKYKRISNSYEFVKFLFFGSEFNRFTFFPKLKLFMDYQGCLNNLEIETVDFECISDNNKTESNITWSLKNVYNKTNKTIKSFYLYSSSDIGIAKEAEVKIKPGNAFSKININKTKKATGLQLTTFAFNEPIKPKTRIPEIKINMKMYNAFDFSRQEVVYVYPKNYGRKVKHINILLKTIGADDLSVVLHEIKKERKTYKDESIKSVEKSKNSDTKETNIYSCSINDDEINVENLYYLLINPLTVTTEKQTDDTAIVETTGNEN